MYGFSIAYITTFVKSFVVLVARDGFRNSVRKNGAYTSRLHGNRAYSRTRIRVMYVNRAYVRRFGRRNIKKSGHSTIYPYKVSEGAHRIVSRDHYPERAQRPKVVADVHLVRFGVILDLVAVVRGIEGIIKGLGWVSYSEVQMVSLCGSGCCGRCGI